ncbi:MAG: excinuclease ABC subunit UvrA [Eubacterium sp.]|nr:excinuclease ABC subunit UvrA [Eubacterium sp.]
MSEIKYITVKGAREHNLKNVDVTLPRNKFIVFTGLSGSGKSSLAFDTIYAEGQRRYMESLSSYARMFLGQADKPDVDKIEGLSPAISIDQKSTNKNPRSTVGTVTEIYDYLRLLYARIGVPHCPNCGRVIERQTVDQMVDQVLELPEKTKFQILAPVVRGRKGTHEKLLQRAKKSGFVRVIVDDNLYTLDEEIKLEKNIKHNIDIVVDRLVIKEGIEKRLADSLETALKQAEGIVKVDIIDGETFTFSDSFSCPYCNISIEEIEPRSFSFNNPFGACPACTGIGWERKLDPDLMIPDKSRTLNEGAIAVSGWASSGDPKSFTHALLVALSEAYDFSMDVPYKDLPDRAKDAILYGTKGKRITITYHSQRTRRSTFTHPFEGLIANVEERYKYSGSEDVRADYESYMTFTPCKVCGGMRLKPSSLAVTIGEKNIYEMTVMPIDELSDYVENLPLTERQQMIGRDILREIRNRLKFMVDVGLNYLSLSRATASLSGGEAQRIRLATQIGSGLVGVTYILDEPSIGLHQRDNDKLIDSLKRLQQLGNTLIVVEHDEETMRAADYIVDIGPRAGIHGGEIVAQGTAEDLIKNKNSITGQYLSGKMIIPVPDKRRKPNGWMTIKGAKENNLKDIDVKIPLGVFTCVTGVSGSGKSSLINEIMKKRLLRDLNRARIKPGKHDDIVGYDVLDKVIDIDQSPIGRTPRSNPATYTGVFDLIRGIFAETKDAKTMGYNKGRFSFNVSGGRCEACKGDGINKIEMHFLPDIYVPCEVCGGKRYNRETLEVRYKGKNIFEVLDMSVDEACDFFENVPSIYRKIKTIQDVGLGYIKLGQPSTTLSGGEAQRIKLATELSKRSTGSTIYVLDEPTTGLHFDDVRRLLIILQKFADAGNTVVVIEHNMDVIKQADYIIDMGPEGGNGGGTVVAQGTPEEVSRKKKSYTGQYLKRYLGVVQ